MCYCVLVPATCAAWFLFKVPPAILTATGHVALNRVDRKSQLECLKQCGDLLHKCASVLFFPEGTRSKTKKMGGGRRPHHAPRHRWAPPAPCKGMQGAYVLRLPRLGPLTHAHVTMQPLPTVSCAHAACLHGRHAHTGCGWLALHSKPSTLLV